MAASVTYTTFNGMIVHENRGGTERDYMPDPLGSTAALLNSSQTKTDTWEYWPYGEEISRSGSVPTAFTFGGVMGYFKDILDKLFYIRARFFNPCLCTWQSVDVNWPGEQAYGYSNQDPVRQVDSSGEGIACIACGICLGAAVIAALWACSDDPRGVLPCIADWIGRNPWAWAIIGGCLAICGACLGPTIVRMIRNLIRPRPQPGELPPSGPQLPPGRGGTRPGPTPGGGGRGTLPRPTSPTPPLLSRICDWVFRHCYNVCMFVCQIFSLVLQLIGIDIGSDFCDSLCRGICGFAAIRRPGTTVTVG